MSSEPQQPDDDEVELGVARENLSRAYALGTDDDIKSASVAVESAKQRVGREVAARHADLIRDAQQRAAEAVQKRAEGTS